MTTETFYVSSDTNVVKKTTEPTREYFIEGGKKSGKAKYIIEVFGNNHFENAKKVQKMVQDAGMENSIFQIKIKTK